MSDCSGGVLAETYILGTLSWGKTVEKSDVAHTLSGSHTPASAKELELPGHKAMRVGPSQVLSLYRADGPGCGRAICLVEL